jgi:MFS superfamily sulfate permease-like transporter
MKRQSAEDAYASAPVFAPRRRQPFLQRLIPISQDIQHYRPSIGRRDFLAGLTVAALAIPSAMAYGEIAGLTPANGLYALLLPSTR